MQEMNSTAGPLTALEHARSGVAQLHARVTALREALKQNQTAARTQSLGVLSRKGEGRAIQHQLALLAPLYRAARAYESNLHAADRQSTPGYATYLKYYDKLLATLRDALSRAGTREPTAFAHVDGFQWMPLLRPVGDGHTLLLGPCPAQLLDELALEQQRSRGLVTSTRSAFLSSLSAEQVALMQAIFEAQASAAGFGRDVVFKKSDLLARQVQASAPAAKEGI